MFEVFISKNVCRMLENIAKHAGFDWFSPFRRYGPPMLDWFYRVFLWSLRSDLDSTFADRVMAVDWKAYHTAYGRADRVPGQLLRLASSDPWKALCATSDLSGGLCDQHVQIATASLPALPFILEVLDNADQPLEVEILDILLGFARGSSRKRSIDFQKACGRDIRPEPDWVTNLRTRLLAEVPRFRKLTGSTDQEIADTAKLILEEFTAVT
jgi:hypothetical protein